MRRFLILLIVAVFVLGACGGGDNKGADPTTTVPEEPPAAGFADLDEDDFGAFVAVMMGVEPISGAELECVGDALLETSTVDDLEEAYEADEFAELTKGMQGELVDAMLDCAAESLQEGIATVLVAGEDLELTDSEATCLSEEFLADLDAEAILQLFKLEEFEELDPDLQQDLVPALLACASDAFEALFADEFQGAGMESDDAECVAAGYIDQLDEDQLGELLDAAGGEVPDEIAAIIAELEEECTTVPPSEPFGPGDDEAFDALYDDCEAGEFDACDALYTDSPLDSEYERFGATCGDRLAVADLTPETIANCATALGVTTPEGGTPIPYALGDDTSLDGFTVACSQGSAVACDDLFLGSPDGTPFQQYGFTCGGRFAEDEIGGHLCTYLMARDESGSVVVPIPYELGDDVTLDGLTTSCANGDLVACDDLYLESAPESLYEEYGSTCGGRVPVADVRGRYCIDIFGVDSLL